MNLIGKMLDNRYEILEKIGIGGMATVYKAKCHVLNRYVAVKILKDEFTTDSDFIRKFNTEAQSAASLTHPNIVSIYDVGNEDNLYYIVMELIQGKTLKEIITEEGRLSWKWSVNIAIQIASALEVAHKNNIVHRDIKPHNIIITEDGMAKVTDFGIAKAVSNSTITAFGTTIGSVHYFSPEHARGGYTDSKSDIYSLGVVMYEMVTGRVPFDADTPVSVALKQVQEEPIDPITYNKDLPVSVNRIILKAMQKDPNYRYQTATEMIKDLSLALKKPNEDFVVLALKDDDSPTQKVPTIYELEMEKNNDRNARMGEESEKNEKGKFKAYLEKHKFIRFLLIVFILIIIFVITAVIAMFAVNSNDTEQSYIPQVVYSSAENMLTEEEATKLLEEAGFTSITVKRESNENVEAGYVISIDPSEIDVLYDLDTKITLTVSSGPEIVVLPSTIVGEKQEDIVSELEKLGLTVNVTTETSETVEEGIILSVDPEEGEEITKSTPVNLVVSAGSQYKDITMISVVGQTETNAITMLNALSESLTVEVTYDEDTSKEDGIVLSQTIEKDKVVKENETITIVVNQLPTESTITFDINVASYYPVTTTETNIGTSSTTNTTNSTSDEEDDDENAANTTTSSTTNTTSSTTTTTKNVTIVIYIGGVQVKTDTVSSDTESYTYAYTTSGSKSYQITVGGNEVAKGTVDFSAGDKTITISD